jgi:hypothetical protein
MSERVRNTHTLVHVEKSCDARASRTHDRTVPRRKPTQNKHNYVHLVRTCWLAESSCRSLCYRVSTRMVHVRSGQVTSFRTRLWAQANNSAMYSCCSTYIFHISVYNFTKFDLYIISSSNLKWRSSPWLPASILTDASEHACWSSLMIWSESQSDAVREKC